MFYVIGKNFLEDRFVYRATVLTVLLMGIKVLYVIITFWEAFQADHLGERFFQLAMDATSSLYLLGLAIHFKLVHKEIEQLMNAFTNGLFEYSNYKTSPGINNDMDKLKRDMRFTELIILGNTIKPVTMYVLWPLQEFWNENGIKIFQNNEKMELNTIVEKIITYPVCAIGFFLYGAYACMFHSCYQILLVDVVSCLEAEMITLCDSICNVDNRGKTLMTEVLTEMENICVEELYVKGESLPKDELERKLLDICTFDCLKENIKHHQEIIK